ncbi:hypothetical protein DSO57_1032117 [Entomophthora muscae]|uniref:Uncharacterized protein n=1 Tax=Entomophthora muscae TaxID=34485 RepID=A0ACC2SQ43_9FUNG|nr:hypothetical protein DSO57_1032117 [Entomophthora muscae]
MKLVGPIMSDEFSPLTQHLSSFLNTKQRVMYIAFGSGVVLSKKDVQILFSAVTQLVEEDKADGIVWALGKTPTPPLRHHKSAPKWMARLCMPKSSSTTNIPRFNLPAGLPKSPSFPTPPSASSSPMAALNPSLKEYTPAPPSSPCPSSATSTAMDARLLRWALAATPDRLTQTASSLHKVMSDMMLDADGKLANSILHWKVIARMNAKRKEEAANLVEEFALTNKVCRLAPGADPNAPFSCGLDHLVPGYHKMNVLLAYGIDVFSFLGLLIFLGSLPGFFLLRSLSATPLSQMTAPPSKRFYNLYITSLFIPYYLCSILKKTISPVKNISHKLLFLTLYYHILFD